MIITRRQFLKNSAAVLAIPAIVKAENLMPIWVPPEKKIVVRSLDLDEMTLADLRNLNDYTLAQPPMETADAADLRTAWANAAGFMLNKKIEAEILKAYQNQLIYGTGAIEVKYG
jgi:hypothetical protein